MSLSSAQSIRDTDPFKYIDVTLTMSLSWSYQHKCMTDKLTHKHNALSESYASPSQSKRILSTAITPIGSLELASLATPNLKEMGPKKGHCVKKKIGMDRTNPSVPLGGPFSLLSFVRARSRSGS